MRLTRPRVGLSGRSPCRSGGPAQTLPMTTAGSSCLGPIPCAARTGSRSPMRLTRERFCGAPSSRGSTQPQQRRLRPTVSSTSAALVVATPYSRSAKTTDTFSPVKVGPAATRAHPPCRRAPSSSPMRAIRPTVSRRRRSHRYGTTRRSAQAAAARQPSMPTGACTRGTTWAAWCSMPIRAPWSEPTKCRECASMRPQSTPRPCSRPSLQAL